MSIRGEMIIMAAGLLLCTARVLADTQAEPTGVMPATEARRDPDDLRGERYRTDTSLKESRTVAIAHGEWAATRAKWRASIRDFFRFGRRKRIQLRGRDMLQGLADGMLGPLALPIRYYRLSRRNHKVTLNTAYNLFLPDARLPVIGYAIPYILACLGCGIGLIAAGSERSRRWLSYVGFAYLLMLLGMAVVSVLFIALQAA